MLPGGNLTHHDTSSVITEHPSALLRFHQRWPGSIHRGVAAFGNLGAPAGSGIVCSSVAGSDFARTAGKIERLWGTGNVASSTPWHLVGHPEADVGVLEDQEHPEEGHRAQNRCR